MFAERKRVESPVEPFVSVRFDSSIQALVTCTYSKDAVNRSGQLRVLNARSLAEEWRLPLSSAAFHLDFAAEFDAPYAAGLGDGRIAFVDVRERRLQVDEPQSFAGRMVTDAKRAAGDPDRVAFVDESGALAAYRRSTSAVDFRVPLAHSLCGQPVNAWSCEWVDAHAILTGGDDDRLKLWDLRSDGSRPVHNSAVHSGGVVRIRRLDAHHFLTGSYDEQLRLLDVRKLDAPLNGGVWDFEVQHERLLVACMYGGWAIVERRPSLRLVHEQPMPDSLVYGVTSNEKRGQEEEFFCCSFTNGVLCSMGR
ncbi:hypothetical protein M3Y99_01567500 [Aphelenchoides fujianensis]|nr:hypothetical protein M3Y99_01567500 [Aphelenchoides fujianensis]